MKLLQRVLILQCTIVLCSVDVVADEVHVSPPRLKDELLNRFIVVPEKKLLFCYIEKVASASFNALFKSLRKQGDNGPLYFRNTPEVHGLNKYDLEGILIDESWHKAIFYREPLERFVSGYLSKCTSGHDRDTVHCTHTFGLPQKGEKEVSFAQAIQHISKYDHDHHGAVASYEMNVHFRQQYRFCGGLVDSLPFYNTIEEYEHHSLRQKVIQLLESIHVDYPSEIPKFETLFPPSSKNQTAIKASRHVTNADKSSILQYYNYNYSLIKTILNHYHPDYLLFGIKAPSWAIRAYEEPDPSYAS